MSHNTPKIGTATQDRVGALGPTVEDLDDVIGAPALNDVLKWTGANWAPGAPSSTGQGTEVVAWVGGYNNFYSTSPQQQAVGQFYWMSVAMAAYRPLYYHDLTSATWINSAGGIAFTSGTVWLNRLELEPGTYILKAQHRISSSTASQYIDVQWQTEAGASLGPIRRIGEATDPCNVPAAVVVASTVQCGLRIIAKSAGTLYAPNSDANQYLQSTVTRIA